MADLRTPPTTTTSPILHIMSWHWRLVNFSPEASLNLATTKLNRSTNGAGPLARPPNVFNFAPAGLTRLTSHKGMTPLYKEVINVRNEYAQPSLESATMIVSSKLMRFIGTIGNSLTY